jgi:Ca2+/Na+ antiporter
MLTTFLALAVSPVYAYYQSNKPVGVGAVANNLMAPVTFGVNFVGSIAISLGICFLLAALVKYIRHRENPLAYPISTVVILIIMGILLLVLPFAYKITQGGVPMSFPYGR